MRTACPKLERLYRRALDIQYADARGLWVPIMRHVAGRGHTGAMIDLAAWLSEAGGRKAHGALSDPATAAGLYRKAWRLGDARAAYHLAMACFNQRDMAGYRRWLARAARCGDRDAALEHKQFETRLWHSAARKIGRSRPQHKRDGYD